MSYIAPSLTPLSGMPAFRIYTVDPITFGVMDVETYYANMDNAQFQKGPVWTKYYSAREAYGSLVDPPLDANPTTELTPGFWHNVTVLLESNTTAFNEYWARRTRGWMVPPCNENCRSNEICQLRAARSQDNCFVPSPGASLGIRQEASPSKQIVVQCDHSVLTETFRSLALRKQLIELLYRRMQDEKAHNRKGFSG